jgi:hypothetical protein
MWFEPLKVNNQLDPIANSANPANYQLDIDSKSERISEISEISSEVVASECISPELAELAELATRPAKQSPVTCGQCLQFKCNNSHGAGAGSCLVGGAYGSWSESQHQCSKFDAAVEWVVMPEPSFTAIMVTVYTPNGNDIEIETRDEAHALWLQQMNPKR